MNICAIVLAAGSGKRMNIDANKVFLKFEEQSAVIRCLKTFEHTNLFSQIIVVCKKEEEEIVRKKAHKYLKSTKHISFCEGGAERQYSVENSLELLDENIDIVLIHDAARCFVTEDIIRNCVASTIRYGSGVAAIPATDTIKRSKDGIVTETLPRQELMCVQTPQTFKKDVVVKAYHHAKKEQFLGTDDASLVERLGYEVRLVNGSKNNIKLTTNHDIEEGERIVAEQGKSNLRIGNGFDMHAFAKDRKLVLGGVEIESEYGLEGHSDADVLIHAVMDALLGAARLGDIGELFPPTDAKYKDIYSINLLTEVGDLLYKYGYRIVNIDSTIIMQQPKIQTYRTQMIKNIAKALQIKEEYVNVKATTTEFLGTIGRGEGAAAQAVCIIKKAT